MLIRKKINENPFLYKIYFHTYRKHRGIRPNFFSNKTELYYDGYPRSGNTFLQNLIWKSFPEIEAVHHLHTVAPIKIALKRSIPCYILIRNPYECISSNYLKYFSLDSELPEETDVSLLNRMVNYYISYYSFVDQIRSRVYIVQFKELIQNPVKIVTNIRDNLKLHKSDLEIEKSVDFAIQSYKGATDKYGSSRPNEYKEKEKEKIKSCFKEMDGINRAVDLFELFSEEN